MSNQVPESVYANFVKAKVSLSLKRHWYPDNNERGYIERCWQDGRHPGELADELYLKHMDADEKEQG